jgi:hypothetical protein
MDGSSQTIARDADGRFLPGCSGNPDGKRPGTRNRATLLREVMREGDDRTMARLVVDRAVGGDAVAARFCLARLEPKPRGRPIGLDLPEGAASAEAVEAAFDSALARLAAGEITPAEAVEISRFLESRIRALRAWAKGQVGDGRLSDGAPASSPPNITKTGERIEAKGRNSAAITPASNEEAEARPHPAPPPERPPSAGGRPGVGSASLSLHIPLPRAGEGADLVGLRLHSTCNSRVPVTPHLMRQVLLGTASHRSLASG